MLTIDLNAIVANYQTIKNYVGETKVAPAVKANAYGLGMSQVSNALARAGCDLFFVATLDEAIALRQSLVGFSDVDITVLHGLENTERCAEFSAYNLIPILNHQGQLEAWKRYALSVQKRLPAILHVDTGMNRLGFSNTAWSDLCANNMALEGLDTRYVMSHLACAEEKQHPMTSQQLQKFLHSKNMLQMDIKTSLANSSGIYNGHDYHFDLVRSGIALYGGNPIPWSDNPMQPTVFLTAPIIQSEEVPAGQTVGYGATFSTTGKTRIITLSLGYADGISRLLGNTGAVYLNGQKLPIVGRISMDLITVDASNYQGSEDNLKVGNDVEIIGEHQKIDDLAKQAKTIGYEVLTSLGLRHQRCYLDQESESKNDDQYIVQRV